jgi:hypothetical protein
MINFIKKVIVRFLTRKVFVVSNKATGDYFIVSHITDDGYVSLLTDNGSYLPVSYSVFKRMFQRENTVTNSNYEQEAITGIDGNKILLLSGESLVLANINEHGIEDSLDSEYL